LPGMNFVRLIIHTSSPVRVKMNQMGSFNRSHQASFSRSGPAGTFVARLQALTGTKSSRGTSPLSPRVRSFRPPALCIRLGFKNMVSCVSQGSERSRWTAWRRSIALPPIVARRPTTLRSKCPWGANRDRGPSFAAPWLALVIGFDIKTG